MSLIKWILMGGLVVGGGHELVLLTADMAKAAVDAHQHQMSYSKFTKAMLNAKPKGKPSK